MVAEYFLDTEFGRPLIFGNEKNEIERKKQFWYFLPYPFCSINFLYLDYAKLLDAHA